MVESGRRKVGAALLLGLLLATGSAEARGKREPGITAAQDGAIRLVASEASALPVSSTMQLGDLRLPPPGYLDYCLRYRGIDRGCR
jgi:hypothetical protein